MKMRLKVGVFLTALLAFSCSENSNKNTDDSSVTETHKLLFEKIDTKYSTLSFSNTIEEDVATRENLFDYDYFYNGAGVGVEDLNNDGLLDIFFCGNQVDNKLFLNTKDFKFTDISEAAKINKGKSWSNGVTFVDINNDGWKDIYVSQGGPTERDKRKNLLFINQKDNTFLEQAEAYGLADIGISTQSAFFDFDKDGDLDCIVMNENEFYGVDPINLQRLVALSEENKYYNSSHLYRNDNGKFVDITKSAGLERPIFGLGLSISDINQDGWLDIYMASDYYLPDALFINKGNGTFEERIKEHTQQISYYGMGLDIADLNNDNLQEIFVLDMASTDHVRSKTLMASMSVGRFDYLVNTANFQHQYMYNSLQLNLGNGKYSNISQLSGMANTDWSWSVLLSDFDLDGHKDVHITNGYRRYALDNDLQMQVFEARRKYGNNVPLEVKKRLYESMPSEKLQNLMYTRTSDLTYKNIAEDWGLKEFSFSNGAATGDFDNDGDLDLVINNIDEEAFLYKNMAIENNHGNYLKVKTQGILSEGYAKVTLKYDNESQFIENRRVRGYRSSHENKAHFGLGNQKVIDTVLVEWPSGTMEEKYNVPANTTLTFFEKDAKTALTPSEHTLPLFKETPSPIDYTHIENPYDDFQTEILLPYKQSSLGPFIAKGDINGDGLSDVHIGGASGQAGQLFVQTSSGFQKLHSNVLDNDKGYEDMEAVFFDFDQDNDLDLYVVSGGNEFKEYSSYYADRIYLNDGNGVFERYNSDILNSSPKSGKSVSIIDFDKDGDSDILVGNRIIPQNYPKHSPSTLYENVEGVLKEVVKEKAPELLDFGIINSVLTTDFNNDGWDDFIAVGEWTTLGFFQNDKGRFKKVGISDGDFDEKGWWYSINETDVNNDGLKDYIVGNVGLNIKFTANKEKPFKIYANDFDDNGTNDIVLSKKYNGEYVPVRGRECSSQQMPFIKEKFESYKDFANAKLVDIYGEKLNYAYDNEAHSFHSLLLLNKGGGKFEKKVLPIEAQTFPVLKVVFHDVNNDGFEDAVLTGNIYDTEVETPRLDAVSGLILLSNQKDNYIAMDYRKSGLYITGDSKDIEKIEVKGDVLFINTLNNQSLRTYKLNP